MPRRSRSMRAQSCSSEAAFFSRLRTRVISLRARPESQGKRLSRARGGAEGVVVVQGAQCAQERLLPPLLAEVAVPADAMEAKAEQRHQRGVGQRLRGRRVAVQCAPLPRRVKRRLQTGL